MKNIICTLLFIVGLSVFNNTQAQGDRKAPHQLTAEQRADRRTELLKAKLLLNEDQTLKVRAAALKAETQKTNDQEKAREARQTFDSEVKAVLDPEQLEKYESLKEQRKTQIKQRTQEHRDQEKVNSTVTDEGQKDVEKN